MIMSQVRMGDRIMSNAQLTAIQGKLLGDAERSGGPISQIYFCPYVSEDGSEGPTSVLGVLWQVQREHHLDLTRVAFVSADERDVIAVEALGCRALLVNDAHSLSAYTETLLTLNEDRTQPTHDSGLDMPDGRATKTWERF